MSAVGSRPIARGRSAEVFADGDDRVVKLAFGGIDAGEVAQEIAASRLAYELGITPVRCHGGVEMDGRHGIVFDRIDGIPLTAVAERNILRLPQVGSTLAAEHLFVHRARTDRLPDVRELADEANRLNETCRIYVNLMAANVRRRLQVLTGDAGVAYRPPVRAYA